MLCYGESILYEYITLFVLTVIGIPWCHFMIALTLDRFLIVKLNITYELRVDNKVWRTACIVNYLSGGLIFLLLIVLKYTLDVNTRDILLTYIYAVYHGIVITICFTVYAYIYFNIKKNRDKDNVSRRSVASQHGIEVPVETQRKQKFIPFWIAASYFMFVIIPYIIHKTLFVVLKRDRRSSLYFPISMLLFDFNGVADAMIYIILNPSTRRDFLRMIKWRK